MAEKEDILSDEQNETLRKSTTMQNSLQGDHNRNDEKTENFEMKLKSEHNNDTDKEMYSNSFQMRRKVLGMELNILETFYNKELIKIDDDKLYEIQEIKKILDVFATPDINYFLNRSENFSNGLMKIIKKHIIKKADTDDEVKNSIRDIEVPDYRSIVTVRGTEEDVKNCIKKAEEAFINDNYDRAESLLLKAERILPTKTARDLLKQVWAAKDNKEYPDLKKQVIESDEQVKTVKEEKSISEVDNMNSVKCLTAFKQALISGNLQKARRMLNKAKRLDPSLDIEEELSQVKSVMIVRLQLLTMALNSSKELIEINDDTMMDKKHDIETHIGNAYTAVAMSNLEKAENDLSLAEKSKDDLINKIKEIRDDVTNCIPKAETAMENGKYDRAEKLLLKAEGIFPNQNAATEPKKNPEPIEQATECEQQINTVKDEKAKSEDDNVNAGRCLTTFKQALISGNLEKAERMLNKAKRLNPSLDIENELHLVRVTLTYREENDKTNKECLKAGECLYKSMKAYDAGDFLNAEQVLLTAKKIDPTLNFEIELLKIRNEMASRSTAETKFILGTRHEQNFSKNDINFAADFLYKAKKAYDDGDFKEVQKNLNCAINFDPSLHLEPYFSKYFATIASRSSTVAKSSHEINTSSIPFLSLEDEKQKEIDIQMERERKKNEEKGKPKIRNADGLKMNTELYSTARLNEEQKNISEIHSLGETYVPSNCYDFPVKANESNNQEASNCIQIARVALQENQYDKAERFLLKSLRIHDSQEAQLYLNIVRSSKAQNNTKVPTQKEKNNNEHEYFPTTKAIAEGNKTENDTSKQLKHNEYVRTIPPFRDQVDLKHERVAKLYINLAVDVMASCRFHVTRYYLERALQIRPNEEISILVRDVEKRMDSQSERRYMSKDDFMFEANRLLDETVDRIGVGDFENAEYVLITSWEMYESQRTTLIYQELLKTQIANLSTNKENRFYKNQIKSYKLVESALMKYKKNKNDEAEMLLLQASELYQSAVLAHFLVEVRRSENPIKDRKRFDFKWIFGKY